MGASRIDRIYTTKEQSDKKIGVETVAATFTDQQSVVMRLSVDVPNVRRGKGFWKMNTSMLSEEVFKERLRHKWAVWTQQRSFYPDWPMWWGRYKKQIRLSNDTLDSAHSLGENQRKEQTVVKMGHGEGRGTPHTAGLRLCKCEC